MTQIAFGAKYLKERFVSLQRFSDFTLIPLVEIIFHHFAKEPIGNFGITDTRIFQGKSWYSYSNALVVDDKIIVLTKKWADINTIDSDDNDEWHLVKRFSFEGDEPVLARFKARFDVFFFKLDLQALIKEATGLLKQGRTDHLSDEMSLLYLGITLTRSPN